MLFHFCSRFHWVCCRTESLFNINKLPSYHVFAYFKNSWMATKGPKSKQLERLFHPTGHWLKPYHPTNPLTKLLTKKSSVGAHKIDEIIRLPFLTPLYLYQTSWWLNKYEHVHTANKLRCFPANHRRIQENQFWTKKQNIKSCSKNK